MIRHYRDLLAWQRSMDLVQVVYELTAQFPVEERFGLTNQMRRSAVSVPSNIAEGQGRGTPKEFVHGLRISNGSRQELETQLLISERLKFIMPDEAARVTELAAESGRLISGLVKSLN